jgi:hypothetical protein
MQTCHAEVQGAVTRHSPAEALAADADRLRGIRIAPVNGGVRGEKMSGAVAGDGASAGASEPGRPERDPGDEPGDGKKRGPS